MPNEAVVSTALNGLLQKILDGFGNTLRARLFVNNHFPGDADTIANYTEATFPGYTAVLITAWSPATTAAALASSTAARCTFKLFSAGGPYPVYGYYVTSAGGALLWAARDPTGPVLLHLAEERYPVVPVFTLRSQT